MLRLAPLSGSASLPTRGSSLFHMTTARSDCSTWAAWGWPGCHAATEWWEPTDWGCDSSSAWKLSHCLDVSCRVTGGWCVAQPGTKRTSRATCSPAASIARPSAGTSTSPPCCRRSDITDHANTVFCLVSRALTCPLRPHAAHSQPSHLFSMKCDVVTLIYFGHF